MKAPMNAPMKAPMNAPMNAIVPSRAENYPEWYQSVIKSAELADLSPVRGCMVIQPLGYSLWENMQQYLDRRFKDTGHKNCYFPLLIPLSFLEREAEHVEGFAKECAVVTHHRLVAKEGGGLKPDGPLEEPHVIRPTSETIIGHMFAKWIQSYRDLPLKVNQWCNVMRWELRTRMFLRTSEFLWQEGHTAHASAEEAMAETHMMLDIYREFAEEVMAMPVVCGEKTPEERFPGAVNTYTIEALMQDGKALQAGTSHFLGQNFSRAQDILFQNPLGEPTPCWTTSWGVSTRLIGGLIMTHSDDDGLRLPPRLAPTQIVVIPVIPKEHERARVLEACQQIAAELRLQKLWNMELRVDVDERDMNAGEKSWWHIKRGTPLRLEIGPRDIEQQSAMLMLRTQGHKDKSKQAWGQITSAAVEALEQVQQQLLSEAQTYRRQMSQVLLTQKEAVQFFEQSHPQTPQVAGGGLGLIPWSDASEFPESLKNLKVSARCIPLANSSWLSHLGIKQSETERPCIVSGKPTNRWVAVAKSY